MVTLQIDTPQSHAGTGHGRVVICIDIELTECNKQQRLEQHHITAYQSQRRLAAILMCVLSFVTYIDTRRIVRIQLKESCLQTTPIIYC